VPRRRRAVRKHLFLAAFGRRLLCDAFSVHATSQQEAEDIRRHMATSHVSIIPPPLIGSQVPDGPIVRQCETRSTPRILIMARLDPIKGFDLILKAMSMLKDADVPCELIVAGSGPYEAVVRAEVSRLGLQARVKFAGHVEGDMKRNLLTCSDVFVLPSYHENFGMAAAEAAAAGIPVVVSDQVGVKDEIRRAKAGIIVPCSAYGLFVALRRVIMDSGLRHELSHNGRVHFAPRLNAVTIGADLAALYRRAANARCRA
jgi:glycosyltransferase involved in cell wall biosynthesis